jgi:hypothetical protein
VQTRDGRIEKHPDYRVQQAIALVFEQFVAAGSVRHALLWFRQEHVLLPALDQESGWGKGVTWRLPVYNTVLKMLTKPSYAGAYAFRRTYTRTTVIDGRPHKTSGHRQGDSRHYHPPGAVTHSSVPVTLTQHPFSAADPARRPPLEPQAFFRHESRRKGRSRGWVLQMSAI